MFVLRQLYKEKIRKIVINVYFYCNKYINVMKKILFLALICLSSVCTFAASSSEYFVDDRKVEQLFTNSVDASLSALSDNNLLNSNGSLALNGSAAQFRASDKSFVAAILLNFFLGGLGIHRL